MQVDIAPEDLDALERKRDKLGWDIEKAKARSAASGVSMTPPGLGALERLWSEVNATLAQHGRAKNAGT